MLDIVHDKGYRDAFCAAQRKNCLCGILDSRGRLMCRADCVLWQAIEVSRLDDAGTRRRNKANIRKKIEELADKPMSNEFKKALVDRFCQDHFGEKLANVQELLKNVRG